MYRTERSRREPDGWLIALVIFLLIVTLCYFLYLALPYLRIPLPEQRVVYHFPNDHHLRRHWQLDDYLEQHADEILDLTPRPEGGIRDHLVAKEVREDTEADTPLQDITRAVEEHYQELERHGNDTQNVHDAVVVKCHAQKYKRLLQLRVSDRKHGEFLRDLMSQGYTKAEIRDLEINTAYREIYQEATQLGERASHVMQVLDAINKGATSVSLTGSPVKDIWVLTLIWKRIHHPDNRNNAQAMVGVLMDQLYDAAYKSENLDAVLLGSTVCVGGRIGRILSVLTRLDADPQLSEPEKDYNEVRNEAFSKCAKVVEIQMKENAELALLYAKPREQLEAVQKEQVDNFEEILKNAIDAALREDYATILGKQELEKLITESQAGI